MQFTDILSKLQNQDLYRTMNSTRVDKQYIYIGKKKLLNLSSNDYLGIDTRTKFIQNQSSSRLLSGNDERFSILEKQLAKYKSKQKSLVYPTGYMANLGLANCIIQKNDLVISDSLNHASIIDTCKLSQAHVLVYKHNDLDDLEKKIKSKKTKFIITEGIFSMDGTFANLKGIVEIAQKHNILLILDDAHGDFVVGNNGKGTANLFGVSKKIDVYTSSLSKGLGSFGGYVASTSDIINLCINKSRSFIYTSALPTFFLQDTLQRISMDRDHFQKKLTTNTKYLHKKLQQSGFNIKSTTHIMPIIIGDQKTTLQFSKHLFNNGVLAPAIRYPTVPLNDSRIRLSITARFTTHDLDLLVNILETVGKKFKII